MKRAAYLILIIIACLFYSFSVFSASFTQTKTTSTKTTSKASESIVKPGSNIKKTTIKKTELPIDISLEKRGENLYVKLSRAPVKVDLYTYKVRLHTFPGRGKIRFDITPYLSKVKKNSITIFAHGAGGMKYQKTFDAARYIATIQKKKTPGKSKALTSLKTKKFPDRIQPGGSVDTTDTMRAEIFIPGGIKILSPGSGDTVGKGTMISVSYQLVRGFDHFPEEIVFTLKRWARPSYGEVLGTVSLDPGEEGTVDPDTVRTIDVRLPYGMQDGWRYFIEAESRNPRQTGKSRNFLAASPENSINVHSPVASDRFPPGVGINIPIEYSFDTGDSPSNVTVQLVKDGGGASMELYSGPPLSSHSIVRPPATDSWPMQLHDEYSIVVSSDDGRIGSSQKFSLNPYRFWLSYPDSGTDYHTSHSPWHFRWHAEGVIDHVQAVLLKGGREMYRWTPHVNPPYHLMGDERTISPEQTWHPAGTDYTFRIEGYIGDPASGATLVAVDESEGFFEVVDDWTPPVSSYTGCSERIPISIVSPANTGSAITWEKNKRYLISWCIHDESVSSVDISLENASTGERWGVGMGVPNRFESSLWPGDGGYSGGSMDWTVPDLLPWGSYRIHIQSSDRAYETTTHYTVYIVNWLDKGTVPARRDLWRVGETRTITWESGGLSDQPVDIFLRHWDSSREYQVADGVPNTGRFSWRILSEALPEGVDRWENVFLKISIDRYSADSEFFIIER